MWEGFDLVGQGGFEPPTTRDFGVRPSFFGRRSEKTRKEIHKAEDNGSHLAAMAKTEGPAPLLRRRRSVVRQRLPVLRRARGYGAIVNGGVKLCNGSEWVSGVAE